MVDDEAEAIPAETDLSRNCVKDGNNNGKLLSRLKRNAILRSTASWP